VLSTPESRKTVRTLQCSTHRPPHQSRHRHPGHPRPQNGRLGTAASPDRCAASAWQPSGKPGHSFRELDRRHPQPDRRHALSRDWRGEAWWPIQDREPSVEEDRSPTPGSLRSLPHPPAANPLGSRGRWDGIPRPCPALGLCPQSLPCAREGGGCARNLSLPSTYHRTLHNAGRAKTPRHGVSFLPDQQVADGVWIHVPRC
jgi:hypothetical protein